MIGYYDTDHSLQMTYEGPKTLPDAVQADLENEVFAHDTEVNLTEAGHALQVVHKGQQIGQQRQEDAQNDGGQEAGQEAADNWEIGNCSQAWYALQPAHLRL